MKNHFVDEEATDYWIPHPTFGGHNFRPSAPAANTDLYSRSQEQREQQQKLIRPKDLPINMSSSSTTPPGGHPPPYPSSKVSIETYENAPTLPRDQVRSGRQARTIQRLTSSDRSPPVLDDESLSPRTARSKSSPGESLQLPEISPGCCFTAVFFVVFLILFVLGWTGFFKFVT